MSKIYISQPSTYQLFWSLLLYLSQNILIILSNHIFSPWFLNYICWYCSLYQIQTAILNKWLLLLSLWIIKNYLCLKICCLILLYLLCITIIIISQQHQYCTKYSFILKLKRYQSIISIIQSLYLPINSLHLLLIHFNLYFSYPLYLNTLMSFSIIQQMSSINSFLS